MSQKPLIWNGNNPVEWSDPSGYCIEDACVGEAAAVLEGGAEVVAGIEEVAGNATAASTIRGEVSEVNGLFAKEISLLARRAGDATGSFDRGITSFTRHALNQIISRDAGRGVANSSIVNTIRTATQSVLQNAGNALKVGGRGGMIVIEAGGKVITVISKAKVTPPR